MRASHRKYVVRWTGRRCIVHEALGCATKSPFSSMWIGWQRRHKNSKYTRVSFRTLMRNRYTSWETLFSESFSLSEIMKKIDFVAYSTAYCCTLHGNRNTSVKSPCICDSRRIRRKFAARGGAFSHLIINLCIICRNHTEWTIKTPGPYLTDAPSILFTSTTHTDT